MDITLILHIYYLAPLYWYCVSILVLMDITLIRLSTSFSSSSLQSFNPCFNGYYTYTSHAHRHNNTRILVSILVLMDITLILISFHLFWINVLSFNPCFNGYYTYTFLTISASSSFTSFNPCFNGYYTYTNSYMEYTFMGTGSFNPCFNGYYTYTSLFLKAWLHPWKFQSLF